MQWQVADALNHMGILPGDEVASIGLSHTHYWARLARVRIVAEIPHLNANDFGNADSSVKSNVITAFSRTGAKAIITNIMPSHISPVGWQRIEHSDYYVYLLSN